MSIRTDDKGVVETINIVAVNAEANRALYKAREPIYPKLAHGTFRNLKWVVMVVAFAVYWLTPWLRWERGENMPDQAVLIDLAAGRFYFFFIEIWPQEVYYVTGLLIVASLILFLITSLAGRVWCGYACPQTVWTDLFIMVERLVEGDRAARIRLAKAPITPGKLAKRTIKHALWLVIGVATGGAWVFYFADAPTLLFDLFTLDAPVVAYTTIAILTATTYVFGGQMREQVCTYMCPWPRIQGALQDEDSLIVSYKDDRGEPRKPFRRGETFEGRGDCIDCGQCVAVCPMGIDIRDGQQLECIHCALCIDACDGVMKRVGQPRGLIDYDTWTNHENRIAGRPTRIRAIRPRTMIYAGLIVLVGLVMLGTLISRSSVDINVIHDRNPLFVTLSDGGVRNGYTVKILNKAHEPRVFTIALDGLPGAKMTIQSAQDSDGGVTVASDTLDAFRVFVTLPKGGFEPGATEISFRVTERVSGETTESPSIFRGPER